MTRVLLKLSGEALAGPDGFGVDPGAVGSIVAEIADFVGAGGQLGVVLGGGNLLRGAVLAGQGMDRVSADHMGMLATVMNGLAFAAALRAAEVPARLFCAVPIPGVAEGYSRDQALTALAGGAVAILSGGTGNPLFTTDTAACLRGIEIRADMVLKATKVDGVYSADPLKHADAERFDALSYDDVLARNLGVMDLPAICLCRDHDMPLKVFDMRAAGALTRILRGEKVGTTIHSGTVPAV